MLSQYFNEQVQDKNSDVIVRVSYVQCEVTSNY